MSVSLRKSNTGTKTTVYVTATLISASDGKQIPVISSAHIESTSARGYAQTGNLMINVVVI